jgi:cytoskeletal protein CcmA (bactofilin family)
MQVSGEFKGDIQLESAGADLEVLEGGKVAGNIKASSVSIKGEFEGEINASGGSVRIERTAKVSGKVAYSHIRMDGGCHNFELTYVQPEREAA